MNTNQLKRFATEARNKLRDGVMMRLLRLGFDLKTGKAKEDMRPQKVQQGALWRGNHVSMTFLHNWLTLEERIIRIGLKQVVEEGAYTWFNRIMAIRILSKNGLCMPVLEFVDSARTPQIVDEARQGRIPPMAEEDRQYLDELLENDSLVEEQLAVLINAWVENNPIITSCFDVKDMSFMALLWPTGMLKEGGFLDMLNRMDFITDADYASPELIGWLYQFYISDRKDEVFAKKGQYDADEIAPATQIFTPNWIVKYMVQNTVGRIFLDANPQSQSMAQEWKYLVEPTESQKQQTPLEYGELEDLKVADLACGSGHILNECFDLLYDLYVYEGYSRREAVTNIFDHNLTGIDIDRRAKQLATFALLLKACQKDSVFTDARCLPNVVSMPSIEFDSYKEQIELFDKVYNLQDYAHLDLDPAFELMQDAQTLGSIMKFDISPDTRQYLQKAVEAYKSDSNRDINFHELVQSFEVILSLTQKYDAIVMNPPYMATNKVDTLKKYTDKYYKEGKADLFAVFMQLGMNDLVERGRMAMINMQSWMFLSSFEALRDTFLKQFSLISMLHLGPRTFDELSGEVVQNTAFVLEKIKPQSDTVGTYYRLVDGKSCNKKEELFLNESGKYVVPQSNFEKIPSSPIGYWLSTNFINSFHNIEMGEIAEPKAGLATGDNQKFQRLWYEVDERKIGRNMKSTEDTKGAPYIWYPCLSGGKSRKWSDYVEYVVNWYNDGDVIKNFRNKNGKIASRPQNTRFYFKPGLTWNKLSTNHLLVKFNRGGAIYDDTSRSAFVKEETNLKYLIGLLCSNVAEEYLKFFNPTMSFTNGDISRLPIDLNNSQEIDHFVEENIEISRLDWDAHETSWDFQRSDLLPENNFSDSDATILNVDPSVNKEYSLEECVREYKKRWTSRFKQLHSNEEELNRRFIEIYGLQNELSPEVPLDEVTILQQGEISIWKEGDSVPYEVKDGTAEFSSLIWHDDVLMKQFLSYAVGCMMGRYRLDRPGIAIAHPNASRDEIAPYPYNGEMFDIDDDAIIPLMPTNSGFYDNAVIRLSDFIRQAYGANSQTENLNYIERGLGKTIEQYFIKDFWKDHKRMYQNRPIYWLFTSKKGAFQVITYMHRMTPYTLERIRSKYLLPYIDTLKARINDFKQHELELTSSDRKKMENLYRLVEECEEYESRLAVVAEQALGFDLDDGVLHNYAIYGDVLAKLK